MYNMYFDLYNTRFLSSPNSIFVNTFVSVFSEIHTFFCDLKTTRELQAEQLKPTGLNHNR